jgi:hypothetical protein
LERRKHKLECVGDDELSGREEVEEVDVFIHLESRKEMRVKGRSGSQSWSKSW